jgi:hypothetical protein
MNHNDQTDSLMFDIDNVVRRYKQEFDLNDQAIVGCLEFVKLAVMTDGEILFSPEDIDDDNNNNNDIRPHF